MLAVPLSFGSTLFWLNTSSCHAVVQGFGELKPGAIAAAEVRMHSQLLLTVVAVGNSYRTSAVAAATSNPNRIGQLQRPQPWGAALLEAAAGLVCKQGRRTLTHPAFVKRR